MTFDELISYEPRLLPLINLCHEASYISSDVFKDRIWFRIVKPEMSKLVGWYCDDEKLKDEHTYDLVYRALIRLLGV